MLQKFPSWEVSEGTLDGLTIFMALANDTAVIEEQNKLVLKYVDDLTIVDNNCFVDQESSIQYDLNKFDKWATDNHELKPDQMHVNGHHFSTEPNSVCTTSFDVVKILGIQISKDLKWDSYISDVLRRASGRIFMLSSLKRFGLCITDLVTIYVGFVRRLLKYAVPVWHPGLNRKSSIIL